MDNASQQMLENVRKRIANLQQIEALILEEFDGAASNGNATSVSRHRRKAKSRQGGRKHQIHAWLRAHGPSTRGEIITGTGLPAGTIGGYLSSEKKLFEHRDGKWHAVASS